VTGELGVAGRQYKNVCAGRAEAGGG
jgi:hypothetical protein